MVKKSNKEVIKEFVEAQSSGDMKRLEIAQLDMDAMSLSKMTDLREIKLFLEQKIIDFGKSPVNFQNTIDYFANIMQKEKDCEYNYNCFIFDTRGMVCPESIWDKVGKFFSASNISLVFAFIFLLISFFTRWLSSFAFTIEGVMLVQSMAQTSVLIGIFFLLVAIYFKK